MCELGFCCGIGGVAGEHPGVVLSLVYRLVRLWVPETVPLPLTWSFLPDQAE